MQEQPGKSRALSLGLFVLLLFVVGLYILHSNVSLRHLLDLKDRKDSLQSETAELIKDIHKIQSDIEALKDDPEVAERLVRDNLGYARKDEKVVWLQADEVKPVTENSNP
ncbi:MAG TPA: septum formation initiator family protein [Thermoanaerobaculia bacterium]|nr:septum formation initiator family protein [Thermoanaerobaculia bacterium]HUM29381.1 septum formation initiator family protein [Thermoanaerobaculia bacterium]HXK67627.1 septum formation initiator family protein [Thermoanaerobaculia bacterium]